MPIGGESIVALEHLDSHVKAILKLKLRAFVHLNPCFDSIHLKEAIQVSPSARPARRPQGRAGGPPAPGEAKGAAQRNPEHFEKNAASTVDFPPIPEKEPVLSASQLEAEVKEFAPNLPLSQELNAQPGDCPNRLAVARLRRRARV